MRKNKTVFLAGGLTLISGASFLFFVAAPFGPIVYDRSLFESGAAASGAVASEGEIPPAFVVTHMPTPESVQGIYMTQCVVGTPSLRDNLVTFIRETSLNSVVIDIKDYSGSIAFKTGDPLFAGAELATCGARDMREFIGKLHDDGVYVIGRITVFQDPYYTKIHPEFAVKRASDASAVWKDHKGLAFVDVGARQFWDYIIALSKYSFAIGFDELNFDYIRYPSDGNMKDAYYSHSSGKKKEAALEEFFVHLSHALTSESSASDAAEGAWRPTISADLFGMVTTNTDDLNIGQVLERALPYFDYIDPMVYPSHYPKGFNGYANVNEHSYDIIHFSLGRAQERAIAATTTVLSFVSVPIASTTPQLYQKPAYSASKIRPWLQSFDYPVPYTPAMVEAQIQATRDLGLSSYLFWDPANKYRSLREVLMKGGTTVE